MRFEPPLAECLIDTFREGLLSSFGHDLVLRAGRFSVEVSGNAVEARFDPTAIRVERAVGATLSNSDTRQIEFALTTQVLAVQRFHEIRFRGRIRGDRTGPGPVRVDGTLSLHGVDRPLSLAAERKGEDGRWSVLARIDQRQFGITPYTAMLGALKVKPEVVVHLSIPADAGGA